MPPDDSNNNQQTPTQQQPQSNIPVGSQPPVGAPQPQEPLAPEPQASVDPATYIAAQQPTVSTEKKYEVTSIISLVTALFIPLVGFICGIVALVRIPKHGTKGKGLAITGIIVAIITGLLQGLVIVSLIVAMSSVANEAKKLATTDPSTSSSVDAFGFISKEHVASGKETIKKYFDGIKSGDTTGAYSVTSPQYKQSTDLNSFKSVAADYQTANLASAEPYWVARYNLNSDTQTLYGFVYTITPTSAGEPDHILIVLDSNASLIHYSDYATESDLKTEQTLKKSMKELYKSLYPSADQGTISSYEAHRLQNSTKF